MCLFIAYILHNIYEYVGCCQQSSLMSYYWALFCVWHLMDVYVNAITTSSLMVHICITLDLTMELKHGWIKDKSAFLYVWCMWCMGRCFKKNTEYIQTYHLNFLEFFWLDSELQSCENSCWQHLKWMFCRHSLCYTVWHAMINLIGHPNIMPVFPAISLEFSDSVLGSRATGTAIFRI